MLSAYYKKTFLYALRQRHTELTSRLCLQERRITPGEALNHAFVTLAHLVDYAHCNNVKASVQMMEVCRRHNAPPAPPLVATLTFNNQVPRLRVSTHQHHSTTIDNLVCFCFFVFFHLRISYGLRWGFGVFLLKACALIGFEEKQ